MTLLLANLILGCLTDAPGRDYRILATKCTFQKAMASSKK